MATREIKPVRIGVVLATTHPVPGRAVRLSKEALEGAAKQFQPGFPMYREHGDQLAGRLLRASVRQRGDGEWELFGEAEVDLPGGQDLEGFFGRFMSIAFIERDPDEPRRAVTIGLDSLAFHEGDREELRVALRDIRDVRVAPYHQFAEFPPPADAIDLSA